MGGRGGGSPAARAPQALSRMEQRSREIHFDVVHKEPGEAWSIIGSPPEELFNGEGLWVSKDHRGSGYTVFTSSTDTEVTRGRSVKEALRKLARLTGRAVNYFDEVARKDLGRFEP